MSGYCSARLGQLAEAAAPSCELCTECRAIHWRLPRDLGQQRAAGGHCQSTGSDQRPAGPVSRGFSVPLVFCTIVILNCISPEVCFETPGLCNCGCISRNLRPPCGSLTCLASHSRPPSRLNTLGIEHHLHCLEAEDTIDTASSFDLQPSSEAVLLLKSFKSQFCLALSKRPSLLQFLVYHFNIAYHSRVTTG